MAFRFEGGRSLGWFFRLPFRRWPPSGWPSGSRLPLFGTHRFGVTLGELVLLPSVSAFATRRVGLRAHRFRFSARTASGLPSAGWPSGSLLLLFGTHRFGVALGGLAFGLTASAFRHAPLRGCRSAGWRFRLPIRSWPLVGLAFGLTAFAFRHAPLRGCPRWVGSSAFRFGDCRSVGWPSDSRLPLFGTHRFGVALGELALPPPDSALAAGRVGLRAHCFRFSARTDPHRRTAEARTDGAQRHDNCFTSKHLSQHVNLPHRTP